MPDDILTERRKALEYSFFHQRDQELLQQLRSSLAEEQAEDTQRARLQEVSGIHDPAVLERLLRLNVAAETFAAMSLYPLVRVAWADLKVQGAERQAILKAARENGIEDQTPASILLEHWLTAPPPKELFDAWQGYVQALLAGAGDEDRNALKHSIIDRARHIAEVAGGILGLGETVATCERVVLDQLAQAFDR